MDKDSLKKKTVAQLRDEAKKIPGAKGLSSMKKDDLIDLLMKQSTEEPKAEKSKEEKPSRGPEKKKKAAVGKPSGKSELKRRIRELKAEKQEAMARQDKNKIKECNRQIHKYKHELRRLAPKKKKTGK